MSGFCLYLVTPLLLSLAVYPVLRTLQAGHPLSYMYPNLLLFTNLREETRAIWRTVLQFPSEKVVAQHIPVIAYADYSMEALRKATNNWRSPVIVRGMFSNTPATEKWATDGYLAGIIGDFMIPVVKDAVYNTLQNDRGVVPFKEAFTEIVENPDSKMYMFFPVKSRFHFNGSDLGSLEKLQALEMLQEKINEVVLQDLEIDTRIWKGFGTKAHSTYYGSQLIIGQGSNDTDVTTGTGWHCAAGNNWFVQVKGSKRWYFMDPKHSAAMHPLRGGRVNMMTGTPNMSHFQQYVPHQYADLIEGDMLYNPDWQWHTIRNYEGLSIGVPIREFNLSLSFQNNVQFSSIVLINKFLEKFGVDIGGYPPV
ncbi:hypothetical protein B484DRAFT_455930 [Ochromonadaceae sp. CCMP2298]|nr:hypothetical protein B484DRAFT_455930 [Ochromonadaceae sp. CCMP2298]